MYLNRLFFTLLVLSTFTLARSSSPISSRTEDDADTAFADFTQFSNRLLDDLKFETNKSQLEMSQNLEAMELDTLLSLTKKVSQVKLKILEIQRSLEVLNIGDNCFAPTNDLDNFLTRLEERTKKCTELSQKVVQNLIEKTLTEFEMQRDDYLGCYKISLDACKNYAINDTCFDNVITTLKNGEDGMTGTFDRVVANAKNKLVAFQLPCQEMIEFEISFYPESLLPPVSQCAENMLRISRPLTCV